MKRLLPVLSLLLLLLVPTAQAMTPRARTIIEDHRHNTGGNDWHVQIEVNRTATKMASLIVYSQKCETTGFLLGAAFTPEGTFDIAGKLPAKDNGTFRVTGSFVAPEAAKGTWEVAKGDCTDAGEYTAQNNAVNGHFVAGSPFEYPPERILGDSEKAERLRQLGFLTRLTSTRFDTEAEAAAQGYVSSYTGGCPGMNHARKRGTSMWGEVLNPRAPQALSFWCTSDRRWILAGYMYRSPANKRPPTFGNLLQWHRHSSTKTANWMSHVWLLRDPVQAFASCVPFNALEDYGTLEYEKYRPAPGSEPCSDTRGLTS